MLVFFEMLLQLGFVLFCLFILYSLVIKQLIISLQFPQEFDAKISDFLPRVLKFVEFVEVRKSKKGECFCSHF